MIINNTMKLSQMIIEKAKVTQGDNPKEMEYLQRAADLLADTLSVEGNEITISFDPPMDLDKSQHGVTIGLGRNPKKIFIMIDRGLSTGEKVRTLAHEMVHVNQLASGRLVILELKDGNISGEWEGEPFKLARYSSSNPWEIEAYTKEKELRQLVVDEIGNFIVN